MRACMIFLLRGCMIFLASVTPVKKNLISHYFWKEQFDIFDIQFLITFGKSNLTYLTFNVMLSGQCSAILVLDVFVEILCDFLCEKVA